MRPIKVSLLVSLLFMLIILLILFISFGTSTSLLGVRAPDLQVKFDENSLNRSKPWKSQEKHDIIIQSSSSSINLKSDDFKAKKATSTTTIFSWQRYLETTTQTNNQEDDDDDDRLVFSSPAILQRSAAIEFGESKFNSPSFLGKSEPPETNNNNQKEDFKKKFRELFAQKLNKNEKTLKKAENNKQSSHVPKLKKETLQKISALSDNPENNLNKTSLLFEETSSGETLFGSEMNAENFPISKKKLSQQDLNGGVLEQHSSSSAKASSLILMMMPSTTTKATISLHNQTQPLNLSLSSQHIAQLFGELNQRSSRQPSFSNGSCGNSLVTISNNYEISSPNYPDRYPPNSHCVWHIQAQGNQRLKIQIFKLSIEHDRFCRFDYLDVKGVHQENEQNKRTKRFCGNYLKGEDFEIGSNRTTIEFKSDAFNEYSGFHLRVIAETQDCVRSVFVYNWTHVISPKYPDSYDDSKNCWTLVQTKVDHRLLVIFEDLRLEPDINCNFDFVEIYDSAEALAEKSLGKFCDLPKESKLSIQSSQDSMLFHFHSDNFLVLRGYKARVVALRQDVSIANYLNCDWNANWQNMTITSPFYPKRYPSGTECETSISASLPTERIIIFFDWIDLTDLNAFNNEAKNSMNLNQFKLNCTLDRLEIYEMINDTEPSNVFCGYRSQPFKYVSKTNSIRLVFRAISSKQSFNPRKHQSNRSRIFSNQETSLVNSDDDDDDEKLNQIGFSARFTFITVKNSTDSQDRFKSRINHDMRINQIRNDPSQIANSNHFLPSARENQSDDWHRSFSFRRPQNASVRAGSSHILFCEMNHQYNNSGGGGAIIWFKGDREVHDGVSSDGSSLLIRQFNQQSVGRYICVHGDYSADAWLTLKNDNQWCKSGDVLFRERPKDQFTSEGEFVMLHCSATLADSQEDVEISWERLPLHFEENSDQEYQYEKQQESISKPVIYDSRTKKLSRGDLLFDRVLFQDSGYYFCVVRGMKKQNKLSILHNQTDHDDKEEECVWKSAARVQVHQRVDVAQYCGRTIANQAKKKAHDMSDVGKIIGGTEAQPGEFPWMVMFWDEKRHVFCGGALLNERWVVTAAHCFTDIIDESTVFVKLGKYDQTETESTEVITKIHHIIKHPHFSNETFDNDIALVKLATHIQFTDHILPICLSTSSEQVQQMNSIFFTKDDPNDLETQFGYVTGWGRLKENGPLPRYLHKIRLPIVDKVKCHHSTSFKVTENMFCAGYGKEIVGDACKGDSGGPFVVMFRSHWSLLGIVSWGEGCGRPEKFGYYTRVNNYDNWIRRLTTLN